MFLTFFPTSFFLCLYSFLLVPFFSQSSKDLCIRVWTFPPFSFVFFVFSACHAAESSPDVSSGPVLPVTLQKVLSVLSILRKVQTWFSYQVFPMFVVRVYLAPWGPCHTAKSFVRSCHPAESLKVSKLLPYQFFPMFVRL